MLELKFQNPVFNSGLNVTCRNAGKYDDCPVGQRVSLTTVDGQSVGEAILVAVSTYAITEVPALLLGLEHDPGIRCHGQLVEEMDRIYGTDGSHGAARTVTVLTFFYGEIEPVDPTFDALVNALAEERGYQDALVRNPEEQEPLSLGEEILLLSHYTDRARDSWAQDFNPPEIEARHTIRKIMAICARALTNHGIVTRMEEVQDANDITLLQAMLGNDEHAATIALGSAEGDESN